MPSSPDQEKQVEKDAVQFVKERYTKSRSISLDSFARFSKYYKLFRNRQTQKSYSGLANLFIPEPYRIVRKKTAKLANAIRTIKVAPETDNDVEGSKIGTQLLNYLRRKLNWFILERLAIQESRIVGIAWIKCLWDVTRETELQPYKGFDLSLLAVDRVFLPEGQTILDVFNGTLEYIIHEDDVSIDELEKNKNYKKEVITALKREGGMKREASALEQSRLNYQRDSQQSKQAPKKINIKEFWGKKEGKDKLIVIANDKYTLRDIDNPYAAILDNPLAVFVPVIANPVAEEIYPVGDIEPAESLFNELNDIRNQRMDVVTFNIDPPKEIIKGANIDKKQLTARRGWFIESAIPNGVRFIPPDMQGVVAAVNEEKNIRGDIQQVTGVIDFAQNSDIQSGVSVDTARGAIIAKGEADVLTEDELEILKLSLRMLYRVVLSYCQNLLDKEFQMRIVEKGVESFVNFKPEEIKGNYDLDVEMKTLQDKTTEQSIKLMMLNQAKTVPGAKIGKFFTDALESIYEHVNIAEYYEEPQPLPPESPKVSISLKGELNQLQSSEVYKTIPGVDPVMGDPMISEEGRQLMRGDLPEHRKNTRADIEIENMRGPKVSA